VNQYMLHGNKPCYGAKKNGTKPSLHPSIRQGMKAKNVVEARPAEVKRGKKSTPCAKTA
jgi:hypothetical protein